MKIKTNQSHLEETLKTLLLFILMFFTTWLHTSGLRNISAIFITISPFFSLTNGVCSLGIAYVFGSVIRFPFCFQGIIRNDFLISPTLPKVLPYRISAGW